MHKQFLQGCTKGHIESSPISIYYYHYITRAALMWQYQTNAQNQKLVSRGSQNFFSLNNIIPVQRLADSGGNVDNAGVIAIFIQNCLSVSIL